MTTDVWIILVGPKRSGKTRLARATSDFLSDYLEEASRKTPLHDPYYVYITLYHYLSKRGIEDVKIFMENIPSGLRTYYDTMVLRHLSQHIKYQPIRLGAEAEETTGMELKTFALLNLEGKYNLFVFDMYGKDFETFFESFIVNNESILLSKNPNDIVRTLIIGFSEYMDMMGFSSYALSKALSKIKGVKDLKAFYSWAKNIVRNTYSGGSEALHPDELTLVVLFSALTGLFDDRVKTAMLAVYGPDSIEGDERAIRNIRRFRDIAKNTRSIISNSPTYIGITHAKIDLVYNDFIERSGQDPLDINTRMEFVDRYLARVLKGPFAVKSIHASLHDEAFSKKLQERVGFYLPVTIPYNVLSSIYALYELCVRGNTTVPQDLYTRVLPYPYAHLYFALTGGV